MRLVIGSSLVLALITLAGTGCGKPPKPSSGGQATEDSDRPLAARFREEGAPREADRKEGDQPVAAQAQPADKKARPAAAPAPTRLIRVRESAAKIDLPVIGNDGKPVANSHLSPYVQPRRTYDTTIRYTLYSTSGGELSIEAAKDLIAFIDKLNTVKQKAAPEPVKEVDFTGQWTSIYGGVTFGRYQGEWGIAMFPYHVRANDLRKALKDGLETLEKIRKTSPSVEW